MLVLRFLAMVFVLAATVAFVGDVTPLVDGTGSFAPKSLLEHAQNLAPDTLRAARAAVAKATAPWIWDNVVATALGTPTFLFFAALAIGSGYLGRRRYSTKVFAN